MTRVLLGLSSLLGLPSTLSPRHRDDVSLVRNARVAPACSLEGDAGVSRARAVQRCKTQEAGREPRTKAAPKATPRDTIEGKNSCETEGHAGHEQSAQGAPQRVVTISAFQRPPQVGMT